MAEIQTKQNQSTSTSLTTTYDSTPTQYNLLIAVGLSFGETLTMVSTGWTLLDSPVNSQCNLLVWYKEAGASEATAVQVSASTGFRNMLRVFEFDDYDKALGIEAHIANPMSVDLWTGIVDVPEGDRRAWFAAFGYNTDTGASISPGAGPYHLTEVYFDDYGAATGSRLGLRSHEKFSHAGDFSPYDEALYFGNAAIKGCTVLVQWASKTAEVGPSIIDGTGTATEHQHATGTGTSTSPAASFSGAPPEGNLEVAVLRIASGDTTTVTPPDDDWALAGTVDLQISTGAPGGNIRWQVWYKFAGASESASVGFTLSASKTWKLAIAEYAVPDETSLVLAPWGHSHSSSITAATTARVFGPLLSAVKVPSGDGLAIIVINYGASAPTGPTQGFTDAFHASGLDWMARTYTESGYVQGSTTLDAAALGSVECVGVVFASQDSGHGSWSWG